MNNSKGKIKRIIRNNDIVVLTMYVMKTVSKAYVGFTFNSMALVSDAVHNFADIIQYIAISISTRTAFKKESKEYPIGRKTLESIVGVAIGISLLTFGFQFLFGGLHRSLNVFGIIEWLSLKTGLNLDFLVLEGISSPVTSYIVAIVLFGSAFISYFVYKYELKNADKLDSDSLKSDAKELKMDMMVEISLGVGFVAAKLFHMDYLDPIFQVGISFLVLHSSYELIVDNAKNLLNMAINDDDRKVIINELKSIEGVLIKEEEKAYDLKAYIPCMGRVRIEALLPVNTANTDDISLIINRSKANIKTLLAPRYNEIDIFLRYEAEPQYGKDEFLDAGIANYFDRVWNIHPNKDNNMFRYLKDYINSNFITRVAS